MVVKKRELLALKKNRTKPWNLLFKCNVCFKLYTSRICYLKHIRACGFKKATSIEVGLLIDELDIKTSPGASGIPTSIFKASQAIIFWWKENEIRMQTKNEFRMFLEQNSFKFHYEKTFWLHLVCIYIKLISYQISFTFHLISI